MFKVYIQPVVASLGIQKPHAYLVQHGLGRSFVNSVMRGRITRLDLRNLEKLCSILRCTPNDIIVYQPKKDEPFSEKHPFFSLRPRKPIEFPADALRNKSVQELAEIYARIREVDREQRGGE